MEVPQPLRSVDKRDSVTHHFFNLPGPFKAPRCPTCLVPPTACAASILECRCLPHCHILNCADLSPVQAIDPAWRGRSSSHRRPTYVKSVPMGTTHLLSSEAKVHTVSPLPSKTARRSTRAPVVEGPNHAWDPPEIARLLQSVWKCFYFAFWSHNSWSETRTYVSRVISRRPCGLPFG